MAESRESFLTATTFHWTPPPHASPPLPSAGGDRDLVIGADLDWMKGLYPGYIIFFVQSALMIAGPKGCPFIYRLQQTVSPKNALLKKTWTLTNFVYTLFVLNYSCIGFMVLSLHETLAAYISVYYIGTIVPIIVFLDGKFIKQARPVKPKAQLMQ